MNLLDFYKSRFGEAVKRQGNGWNGPCPICGGQPGKSDRFMVWPERSESLGELCAKHMIKGIWSCRQCNASGDTIAYLVKCEGMKFRDALAELGIEGEKPAFRRRRAPEEPPAPQAWTPADNTMPTAPWLEAAEKLVVEAEKEIWNQAEALGWLAGRGILSDAVEKYRIGYITPEIEKFQGRFRPRKTFGLAPKVDAQGKSHDRLFIPRGILIPTLDKGGHPLNIRIRRHNEDLRDRSPKYLELEGSRKGPMLLQSSQPKQLAAYFITEAELDAILIHSASQGVAGAIAVRTNRGKPDISCHSALRASVRICVALDYDDAGAQGLAFWEATYPQAIRWPTPEGKDPGDAIGLGVDIAEWVAAGLPDCIALPEQNDAIHGSIVTQNSAPAPEVFGSGQVGSTASGSENLGGGEEKGISDKGSWPSVNRARLHEAAMAEDYATAPSRWDKSAPVVWASDEDFTKEELALLKGALPRGARLDDVYLEVAVIWLLWRNAPVAFVNKYGEAGQIIGYMWEYGHEWAVKNREQFDLFWRYQTVSRDFWSYIREYPAKKVTWRNLLWPTEEK